MEFTTYIAIAVVLYAIREATGISNRFIPLVAIFLGFGYAFIESHYKFDSKVLLNGLQMALYGIGSVAGVKYFVTKEGTSQNDNTL